MRLFVFWLLYCVTYLHFRFYSPPEIKPQPDVVVAAAAESEQESGQSSSLASNPRPPAGLSITQAFFPQVSKRRVESERLLTTFVAQQRGLFLF